MAACENPGPSCLPFFFFICVCFFVCVLLFYLRFAFLFAFSFFHLRFPFFICVLYFFFVICVLLFCSCCAFLFAFSFLYLRFLFCLCLSLLGHRRWDLCGLVAVWKRSPSTKCMFVSTIVWAISAFEMTLRMLLPSLYLTGTMHGKFRSWWVKNKMGQLESILFWKITPRLLMPCPWSGAW